MLKKMGMKVGLVKERTWEDDVCEVCPKLTLKQRLSGFLGLTCFGYMLTIMATLTISEGYDKEVRWSTRPPP